MPGKGKGPKEESPVAARGLGLGVARNKRHRKILRDNIKGITKGAIRRLARRGSVKRISAMIYDEVRLTIRTHLQDLLKDVVAIVDMDKRKTATITDIVFVLNRRGRPLYGFGDGAERRGLHARD